ncbi:bifunctional [glutamate--ammonia ligase]-adenylyl-L-tyrosine phosphorylase/[glutamate--ammonia-ligase] adenylyltransferase [Aquisalimonas sp.]|uniref:bifunctional [glutamate--ammonia ligase]-adenylyl-L-tyrosine phosphorylase/[glutamate--ammonia-ligase] adenylyltransferase n=2 Tax=unclassified Aquisalimonas TaxID=2644645 RepID=UPI0025C2F33D|nr:bifunctional [glutamate--ammonia ligase]-adenylyl-L-tyrosine phosphorylase/[glutamate--ammonia-ligase] adenylyltransferase [Aquisalimonas sp.]
MSHASDLIDRAMSRLPERLRGQVTEWISDYQDVAELPHTDMALQSLPTVWAGSPFVALSCIRAPELLDHLAHSGDLEGAYDEGEMASRAADAVADCSDEDALNSALRRYRRREMVRIAWRDLAGWASLGETLRELSALADACIQVALDWHLHQLQARFGEPRNADGEPVTFYVLGMGKLGGRELNYSSDIDLIFGYSDVGETHGGRKSVDNQEFFTRLGQKLINSLNARLVEGFVFRVDMRLRPYGDSGPLVMHSDQLETYYEAQGREWERYAMIKARVVAGDQNAGGALMASLRPFVYRRYLDYGALESLRDMKAMIAREVERRGLEHNIKLGAGGIREVEFVGQAFQLIRGGRERGLQERSIIRVLEYLGQHNALPGFAVRQLLEGYEFLRRTENRLQAMQDKQVHELPEDTLDQQRLAYTMGFDRWDAFAARLSELRRHVHDHFEQVFAAPQAEHETTPHDQPEIGDVWSEAVTGSEAEAVLQANGFEQPADCLQRIAAFRGGSHCRALTETGRERLDRLMPLLIGATAAAERPDATLTRLLDLLEAIVRRTSYLALLVEHPMALSQLVKLCSASPWIARHVSRHPMLLDELLDPRTLYAPLKRKDLAEELRERLDAYPGDDLEQRMEVLRQFKQANALRVAASDLAGVTPLMVVSDHLVDIAEVVLGEVLDLAWSHLEARHGRPTCQVDGETVHAGFAIIAYGKLGGLELGYGSDLDVVFVHDSRGEEQVTDGDRQVDNNVFFMRLAQRIIHILGATMAGGVLYEVDTRLRPSGRSGLLATSLDAFAEYQREQAWTWEHQALVRARYVAGSAALGEQFAELRTEILRRPRDRDQLRIDVRDMRERMREQKGSKHPGEFSIKQDRGGIADIEFMVQYGVLSGAADAPRLLRYTDNIRLLGELRDAGWISRDEAELLVDAYRTYRSRVHQLTLQEEPAIVPAETFREMSGQVAEVWHRLMDD